MTNEASLSRKCVAAAIVLSVALSIVGEAAHAELGRKRQDSIP